MKITFHMPVTLMLTVALMAAAPVVMAKKVKDADEGKTSARPAGRMLYVSEDGADLNPGTKTAPLRTIVRASQLAEPGMTILVAPGNYPGGFTTKANGLENAPIRYVSEKKWGAKIIPSPDWKSRGAWDNTGNYVDIDGFEVDGSKMPEGQTWWGGISTSGSYTRITNNLVHHIATGEGDCVERGGAGIGTTGYFKGSNHTIERNVVHNIGPYKPCGFIHGIYIGGPVASVKNNLIYKISYGGVHLWHDANRVEIANNTIFNSEYGIIVGGAQPYHTNGINDYTHVSNNIVFDCRYGIFDMGKTGPNNTYTNNLVTKIRGKSWGVTQKPINPISEDPKFVNYMPGGGGDYRLQQNSPAKGRGSPEYAPDTDLNGVPRNKSAKIDLGAYQS